MAIEKRHAEATINRGADDIWAVIGNFLDISWIPGSEQARATMNGDLRTVTRDGWDKIGFKLVQRLTEHDNDRWTYSYVLPEPVSFEAMAGPGRIAHAIDGTLKVTPISETQSLVTWDLEAEDFLIDGAHKEYQNALDTVKARLESEK
jgi:hypothetical protein